MKYTYLKLVILFFTLTPQIFAQQNFDKVDAHALKVGKLDSTNMGTIATLLTKPFAEKVDKVRAIYTWVANNIIYDVKAASKEQTDKNKNKSKIHERKITDYFADAINCS